MPVYLYRCECELLKEVSHSIAEEPEVRCECGREMKRKPQPTTVTFNGTGWGKE
jgi:putative FmdB family regulatory protein